MMSSEFFKQLFRSAACGALVLSSTLIAGDHRILPEGPQRPHTHAGCQPNWGFNQTCWQRFPPLPPCDQQGHCPDGQCGLNSVYSPQPMAPAYSQPAYAQPEYSQPVFPQSVVPQPTYSQPAYSQPMASPGQMIPGSGSGMSGEYHNPHSMQEFSNGGMRYGGSEMNSVPSQVPMGPSTSVPSVPMGSPSFSSPGFVPPVPNGMSLPPLPEVPPGHEMQSLPPAPMPPQSNSMPNRLMMEPQGQFAAAPRAQQGQASSRYGSNTSMQTVPNPLMQAQGNPAMGQGYVTGTARSGSTPGTMEVLPSSMIPSNAAIHYRSTISTMPRVELTGEAMSNSALTSAQPMPQGATPDLTLMSPSPSQPSNAPMRYASNPGQNSMGQNGMGSPGNPSSRYSALLREQSGTPARSISQSRELPASSRYQTGRPVKTATQSAPVRR